MKFTKYLWLSMVLPLWANAERLPLQPQPVVKYLQNPIIFSPTSESEFLSSSYFNQREGIVTFDPVTEEYTVWYNGHDGKRTYSTYQLGNLIKVDAVSRAKKTTGKDEYVYEYTLTNHPDSPQYTNRFQMMLTAEEVGVDQITYTLDTMEVPEHWHSGHGLAGLLTSVYHPHYWLMAGKSATFKLASTYPPRYEPLILRGRIVTGSFISDIGDTPGFDVAFLEELGGSFHENGVEGIVIAPGTEPLPPPLTAINELLDHAKRWGWVSEAILEQMQETVNDFQPSSDELSQLIDNLLALANGAPEVDTMLTEIKRNLPEE